MPYDPSKRRQRALHVPDAIWEKFKKRCHKARVPIQAVLNELIEQVADGHVKIDKPRKVLVRFALGRTINLDHRTDFR